MTRTPTPRPDLAALYSAMPTHEIECRLAAGGLIPDALAAAEAELASRSASASAQIRVKSSRRSRHGAEQSSGTAWLFRACAAVPVLALLWLYSPLLAVVLGSVLMSRGMGPLAKRFPALGMVFGVVFTIAPFVGAYLLWQEDISAGGGWAYLIAIIVWFVFLVLTTMSWVAARNAFFGASHRGGWDAFEQVYNDPFLDSDGDIDEGLVHVEGLHRERR